MLSEHERYYGLGMDALVIVCSWNTNGIMAWARMLWSSYAHGARTLSWLKAWMLWSSYSLGARTFLWFGHGCSGHRMLSEHERYYGLGMDALVIVCSWNTNVIMAWARMLWSSYALGTRTLSWFGHGCSGHRMLSEHERSYGLGMVALVMVCSRSTNVIMVWAWMLWSSYALGTRTLLWARYGLAMDEVQIRILLKPEHEP